MGKLIDLTGQKFGRLTVIERSVSGKHGNARWLCRCDCGGQKTARSGHLIQGRTKSCGCLNAEMSSQRKFKHGCTNTPEFIAWVHIKQRCYNKKDKRYDDYGGRGIKVCDRWLKSFDFFLEDMGLRPIDCSSIDRIDVNGNYEPDNCRWANQTTQANNTRSNRRIEFNGLSLTVSEWGRATGIKSSVIRDRIDRYGWTIEEALTKPTK
jgi:hypothetical protein